MTFGYEGWDVQGGTATEMTIDRTIKRSGNSSMRLNGTNGASVDLSFTGSTVTRLFYRQYLYITSNTANFSLYNVWNNGVDASEGRLVLDSARKLNWRNDTGVTVNTGSTVLNVGQWYRIEVDYNNPTVTGVIVYIDGVQEFNTGVITGDAINSITVGDTGINADLYYDDLGINDTSGTSQTGLLGEGKIVYMQPDSVGDNNGCSAGDWSSVDDITPDDATTVCNFDAISDILDVNTVSPSSVGINAYDKITLVQIGEREAGASAALHAWNLRVKSAASGAVSSGSAFNSSSASYFTNNSAVPRNYELTAYVDPTTNVAWTANGVNSLTNMQIGLNATDATPNIKLTAIWALVEYVVGAVNNPDVIIQGPVIINGPVRIN